MIEKIRGHELLDTSANYLEKGYGGYISRYDQAIKVCECGGFSHVYKYQSGWEQAYFNHLVFALAAEVFGVRNTEETPVD